LLVLPHALENGVVTMNEGLFDAKSPGAQMNENLLNES
jgi:hypothetical protein